MNSSKSHSTDQAESCLAARGAECARWEAEINTCVVRLYGLTPEETKLVEGTAHE
jgi:hypothetical protein